MSRFGELSFVRIKKCNLTLCGKLGWVSEWMGAVVALGKRTGDIPRKPKA
jgi:hypothetical protein